MKLYLVQHAEAKREEEDPARPLTERGWTDARRVAAYGVQRAGVRPRRVLHSGKTRAVQTAAVWADVLPGVDVVQADALDPDADPTIWAGRLEREMEDVMLVGHLPHLRRLASLLLCGDARGEVVAFENGGVVCLERDAGHCWVLRWALVPGIV